jgi:cytidine deaminase
MVAIAVDVESAAAGSAACAPADAIAAAITAVEARNIVSFMMRFVIV